MCSPHLREVPAIDEEIRSRIDEVNKRRHKREFMLAFSESTPLCLWRPQLAFVSYPLPAVDLLCMLRLVGRWWVPLAQSSADPVNFVSRLVASQARDLKQMYTDQRPLAYCTAATISLCNVVVVCWAGARPSR